MSLNRPARARRWLPIILAFAAVGALTILLLALLTNIFERKQEARQPFVRVVEVTEETADPKPWGQNWPFEYDSYLKTSLPTTTVYGGREPATGGPLSRSSTRSHGSGASSPATRSPSTIGIAAVTPTRSSTRSRRGG